jgi:dTDP-glucose 4,6-dehydratase
MNNILVTGGLGFIGSNFIEYVFKKAQRLGDTEKEYKIVNVDLETYASNKNNLPSKLGIFHPYEYYKADINDTFFIRKIVEIHKINYIVNFSAETHVDNSINDSSPFIHSNINGTHSLLSVAMEADIDKYIQVSTDEVYGSLKEEDEPFTEQHPIKPNSPYSASKASADLLCRSYYETYNLPVCITRCSNNYGKNQHKEKLIPLMIQQAKAGKKLPVYGDGRNIRDWLHVEDHCSAILKVLENGKVGEVYNIGGNNELRNIQIVECILDLLGKGKEQIEYVKDRLGHDWRYAIDSSKIRKELGWNPRSDFTTFVKTLNSLV